MNLTVDQVAEMAPDSGSAAAGKKLMALKNWTELGQSAEALWGKCQGSALYQVRVDLSNMGYSCNCPSRKFPCKHVLGLMMLTAASPGAVAKSATPDWLDEWIAKRRVRDEKKSQEQTDAPKKPVDEKAQQRRADQREARVRDGIDRLDLWLNDLARNGLAGIETKPASFWDDQSKRLVDAQAPGLASRVASLATIPGSSRDWPEKLLFEIGRMKLLLRAWQRIGELDGALQSDVRQIIGWNVGPEEIESAGDQLADNWVVVGQWVDDDSRVRAQRSWLIGRNSRRTALVLQFAAAGQPFGELIVPGTEQLGLLAYYPGAAQSRAKFGKRDGNVTAIQSRIPGFATIDEFLSTASDALARQPWQNAFGCVLHDVTLVPDGETWFVRDGTGFALPLRGREQWKSFAVTGGHPFDLTGEWDGYQLRVLGLYFDSHFQVA